MNRTIFTSLILIGLLITTFLFGKYEGGFVSWFLFYAVAALLFYMFIVYKFSLREVKMSRIFNKSKFYSGEDIIVNLLFKNHGSMPHAYLIISDVYPKKLKMDGVKQYEIIYPWFKTKMQVEYVVKNVPRGVYVWEHIDLLTGDPFGLIKVKRLVPVVDKALVYPKFYTIVNWNMRESIRVGNFHSQNRINEDTSSVVGVRDYRYGDRYNRIHWKQTAKSNKLMTKEFEKVITNNYMFFLNQSNSNYSRQEHFEAAIELTASLVKHTIDLQFPSGIVSLGTDKKMIQLLRGQDHLLRIYEVLAMIEPMTEQSFKETVISELAYLSIGTTLILVTAKLNQELYELLGELGARKIRAEVFALISDEDYKEYTANEQAKGINSDAYIKMHLIPYATWMSYVEQGVITFD